MEVSRGRKCFRDMAAVFRPGQPHPANRKAGRRPDTHLVASDDVTSDAGMFFLHAIPVQDDKCVRQTNVRNQ
eukprot:scaffold3373_cov137-Cylindrotheca_fusiformis.AAC.25